MPNGMKRVFATPLTAVETTDKEGVGTLRREGNKEYKWVLFKNTTATVAVVAGDPVAYAVDKYDSHQVVSDFTDADAQPIGAGVVLASVAGVLATSYFCWIQTRGPVDTNAALAGTPVVGSGLMLSTTDKTFTLVTGVIYPIAITYHVANKSIILQCPK